MDAFRFPDSLSLGVATAATQIDGDCQNSSWYDWYQKGHIKDGSDPDVTTAHRRYMREDIALMASLGIRDYRFGLEWARIEPEEGVFSQEEFQTIRRELTLLREAGIRPLVTLHHFSNPLWFEKKGGFFSPDALPLFLRYVKTTVEALGELACEYITINEPNVYAMGAYLDGGYPPGENSLAKTLRVMDILGVCHRRAYETIHAARAALGLSDTKVGFAHHMRVFAPYHANNPWHRVCAGLSERLFQGKITRSYLLGTARDRGVYADFLALNYYARTASRGFADGTFPGVPVNDLGWEIYPEGIVRCGETLHRLLPELPIYITENGTADAADAFRRRFLYEHLKALCASGLPVERYYHWCFVDNLEWQDGFTARFGLVELDTATLERRVRESGRFYRQMIENRGVTEAMAAEALKEAYPLG